MNTTKNITASTETPLQSPENAQAVECAAEGEKTAQAANDAEYMAELSRRVKTAVKLGAVASDTTGAKIVKIHAAMASHYMFDFGEGAIVAELSNGLFLKYNIREYKCPAYILNPRESQTLGYMLFAAPKCPGARTSNRENRTYKTLRGCLKYYGMKELPEADKITFATSSDGQADAHPNVTPGQGNADKQPEMPQMLNLEYQTMRDFEAIPNIAKLAKAGIIINGNGWHTEYLDQSHNVLARVDNVNIDKYQGCGIFGKTAIFEKWEDAVIATINELTAYRERENEPKAERMKSYADIERQVNRIIVGYLVDDYSQPLSPRHDEIVLKVHRILRRYIYNINRAEGFIQDMTFEEAEKCDYGGIYHVYKDRSKRYPRAVYMGAAI